MEKNRGTDNYFASFKNEKDFLKELESLDKESWIKVVNLDTLSKRNFKTSEEGKNISMDKKAFPKDQECMLIKIDKLFYPISHKSIHLIADRFMDLGKKGVFSLYKDQDLFRKVAFNNIPDLSESNKIVQLIIIDKRIQAAASKGYQFRPAFKTYNVFKESFENRFKDLEFIGGTISYDEIIAKIKIPDQKKLALLYGDTLKYEMGVQFKTSDTCKSSTEVFNMIILPNGNICMPNKKSQMEEKISMIHRGKDNTIEKFEKTLNKVIIKANNFGEAMERQQSIKISYEDAQTLLERICLAPEFEGIGKRDILIVKDTFEAIKNAKKIKYEEYLDLLDEDEEAEDFVLTMFDVVNAFISLQKHPAIKEVRISKLEYLASAILLADLEDLLPKKIKI